MLTAKLDEKNSTKTHVHENTGKNNLRSANFKPQSLHVYSNCFELLNTNWHEARHFTPPVLFSSDFFEGENSLQLG